MEQELHQPMELPPGFHFHPANDEQSYGSQDGGQLDLGLLPLEQTESQLPVCIVSGEQVGQEAGNSKASRAVATVKSLWLKRKVAAQNALKPPTGKQRKSPGSHVQLMRSPQLKRILLSPRMGHHAAKRLRSSSVRGTGLLSDELNRSLSSMSSSSASPDDTSMDISHSLVPDGPMASVNKRKGSPCKQDGDDDCQAEKMMKFSIPGLPEDILHHIHSMLPLRDAARAACLSHSFLRFWRCHPILTLNRDILSSKANARQESFSCIVDHILRNHSGIGIKIFKLELHGIVDACHYLDSWLQTAVTPGIEELTLELCHRGKIKYNISCSLLSDGVRNSIWHLQLGFCAFRPTAGLGPLINLTRVVLCSVRISGDELECFLSKSPALEQLKLHDCKEIICLKIPSVLQQLCCLELSDCWNLQVIESKARNLSRFILESVSVKKLSLGETFQMKKLSLQRANLVCHARTELPSSMPNLETLAISSHYERVDTPVLPTKFLFLKHLEISLVAGWTFCPSYDYFSLVSFLDASPYLENWLLNVSQENMKHESVFEGSSQLRQMPEQLHGCLKSVKFTGFNSAKSLVELTCTFSRMRSHLITLHWTPPMVILSVMTKCTVAGALP